MAAKKKDTGMGRTGFFADTQSAAPTPAEPVEAKAEKHRTTVMLSDDDLDLITLLKRHYRRQGEKGVTQSELCARGLRLLAKQEGIEA